MSKDVKVIMGAGQGFDCLTVKSEPFDEIDGYSSITSVVNTLAIDDFQDEMPVPTSAVLIKDSYLRDLESEESYNDAIEDDNDEISELFGSLMYIKSVAHNDLEMSFVCYEKGFHITCFAVENGTRQLIGNKFFDVPEEPNNDLDKWTECEVIKTAFNHIESYDDAARFVGNYVFDKEMLQQLQQGFVSEDTSVTFAENAWELKENEDGQEEG